jgi:hypothetical protein
MGRAAGRSAKRPAHKVQFGTPPPQRRDYHWTEVAEQLRAQPGVWAKVHADLPSSVVWTINRGRVAPVAPHRGFETRTVGNRPDEKGKRWCAELWMVYLPENDTTLEKKAKRNGAKT